MPAFADQYARSREAQAESLFDEILDIVDDSRNDWIERETKSGTFIVLNEEAVARSRMRMDARKWMAGKLRPKVYGERVGKEDDSDTPRKVMIVNSPDET